MGAFSQTVAAAFADKAKAVREQLEEQQAKQEMAIRQQEMAARREALVRSLQMEKMRERHQQAQEEYERKRLEVEQQRWANAGWLKIGEHQKPDGSFEYTLYNPQTTETRRISTGVPERVVTEKSKEEAAAERQKKSLDAAMARMRESARLRMQFKSLSVPKGMNAQQWKLLQTDPGWMLANQQMRAAVTEAMRIDAAIRNDSLNPDPRKRLKPEELDALGKQLEAANQRATEAAKTMEEKRNQAIFNTAAPPASMTSLPTPAAKPSAGGPLKPPKPGIPITKAAVNAYVAAAGGDRAKARVMAGNDGWDISKPPSE